MSLHLFYTTFFHLYTLLPVAAILLHEQSASTFATHTHACTQLTHTHTEAQQITATGTQHFVLLPHFHWLERIGQVLLLLG